MLPWCSQLPKRNALFRWQLVRMRLSLTTMMDNKPTRLWRKYESDLTEHCNFAKKLPGVRSLSELPSGSNQLRHMKTPLVQKLWIEKHPV